jgi:cation-transporting ATPase E
LVLLDDRFATLPSVVAEGRRVIANIERVARLFVTKNSWAAVLAVLTAVLTISYPIRPRQLTVIDALTIGIPGFVLSFQPSHDPVRTGFIPRVLRFSIPAGLVVGVGAMTTFYLGREVHDLDKETAQSGTTLALCALGIWVLYELARPLDALRRTLVLAMIGGTVVVFTVPFLADFFVLEVPPGEYLVSIAVVFCVAAVVINRTLVLVERRVASR